MSDSFMFKDLPATFPEKDKYQKPSIVSSVAFHVILVCVLIVLPLVFPSAMAELQLRSYLIAPLPPPPGPPPAPPEAAVAAAQPVVQKVIVPEAGALVSPVEIPKDIATVIDEPNSGAGLPGGVPGGVPGGLGGGILGGILGSNTKNEAAVPPPPPPPPPPAPPSVVKGPIRVGGNVKEPQVIKLVPPVYPALALKARVSGTVILEATLTEQGTVENIKVISGHPLLVDAAIDCVKQWVYEPTYLNGQAVPIILTAQVVFHPRAAY